MASTHLTIFLCGDVMTGRGIDQVLPHPSSPEIFEPYVRDARRYVNLAEEANGIIPRPVDYPYVWGYALEALARFAPAVRIINLETAITARNDHWRGKGINYRMDPRNILVLSSAGIQVCSLANNHVLDWGYDGLAETLRTLRGAGIGFAGAGRDLREAEAPAIVNIGDKGRVIVFSFGTVSSGIPAAWGATPDRPGVNLLHDLGKGTIKIIASHVKGIRMPGDIVIASIHWGGNWGYGVPREETEFAHMLIDLAGVDIVHGHSSHHPKGIELHGDRPIIYGCGDFINDYEGIGGYEEYRGELGLMYFVRVEAATGRFAELRMIPTRLKRFRVIPASREEAAWLAETLNREGKRLGTRVELECDDTLLLKETHRP